MKNRIINTIIIMLLLASTSISLIRKFTNNRILKVTKLSLSCEVYCPDKTFPRRSSLYPAPKSSSNNELPPYIFHIKTEKAYSTIEDCIKSETKLELTYIKELIEFGAVYIGTSSPLKDRQRNVKVNRYFINDKQSKTNNGIGIGTYIRVHVNPRRHTSVYDVVWKDTIIRHNNSNNISINNNNNNNNGNNNLSIEKSNNTLSINELILVDKPSTVPTVPTVDNYIENVWFQVMLTLSIKKDIYICSRLDTCTSGLIPFALNEKAASLINKVIRSRSINKVYKALTNQPMKIGKLCHSYRKVSKNHINGKPTLLRPYDPKLIDDNNDENMTINEKENWIHAELEIVSCKKLDETDINYDELQKQNGIKKEYYESEINLITGRTHQIRLQFAAEGNPIVGDTRYLPVSGLLDDCDKGENSIHGDGTKLFGPDPKRIGLQCSTLQFPTYLFDGINDNKDEEYITFTSKTPWWIRLYA